MTTAKLDRQTQVKIGWLLGAPPPPHSHCDSTADARIIRARPQSSRRRKGLRHWSPVDLLLIAEAPEDAPGEDAEADVGWVPDESEGAPPRVRP